MSFQVLSPHQTKIKLVNSTRLKYLSTFELIPGFSLLEKKDFKIFYSVIIKRCKLSLQVLVYLITISVCYLKKPLQFYLTNFF